MFNKLARTGKNPPLTSKIAAPVTTFSPRLRTSRSRHFYLLVGAGFSNRAFPPFGLRICLHPSSARSCSNL